MPRIAVIDLGTNTFHLLIADLNGPKAKVIHKEKQSVKIGEGGISDGQISKPAQKRALNTLQAFNKKIKSLEVESVHATATSAFRNASNGVSLAGEILQKTGIQIDIIDGRREARLIYLGVKQALDLGKQQALIMDIGGGSVEFIICNESSIEWMQSFEIGAQRLMDKFHHHDPITDEELARLDNYLDAALSPLASAIEKFKPLILIGASGTFDTLSQIYCLQEEITKADLPEQPLSIPGFHRIYHNLIHKTKEQRMVIPGMIEMRVDMIVVASSLIKYLLEKFTIEAIRVSAYALKEGLLHQVVHGNQGDNL